MIETNFNLTTGILETSFEQNVELKEITNYIQSTKLNKSYPRVLKIMTDARDANFSISIDDLEIIMEENKKSLEQYDKIIDAIIVNTPEITAISMLYKEFEDNEKYFFNIFSTKEAAHIWLNSFL